MSRQFSIDKGVLGTSRHFFFNGTGFIWVDEHPLETFVFRHSPRPDDLLCLNTLFRLNGVEFESLVPQHFINTFKAILRNDFDYETIKWQYILQPIAYKTFLGNLTKNIQENLDRISIDYHTKVFSRVTQLFKDLDFASIDVQKLDAYKLREAHAANKSNLESFRPIVGSMARKTVYERFGTRTGRLTVASGPEILTLKRNYRDILRSSYSGGKIFYADFSALEARAILTIAGRDVLVKDVYTDIAENYLKGKYSRGTVKLAVIAMLYGSGTEALQSLLKVGKTELQTFTDSMKSYFGVDELRSRLYTEWVENDKKIKNFYGRVLTVPEESTLINSYIQSTGVDIALLGFLAISEGIKKHQHKVSPLFILHDALILDVHPQHFNDLQQIVRPGLGIPGMKNRFFIQIDELVIEQQEDVEVPSEK